MFANAGKVMPNALGWNVPQMWTTFVLVSLGRLKALVSWVRGRRGFSLTVGRADVSKDFVRITGECLGSHEILAFNA